MANTKIQSEQIADDVALAGSPTTTTQSASDNSTKVATTAYVTTAVANLVDSAPSSLNTLNELAAAMNDNASFFSTVLPLSGGTMTGNISHASDFTLDVGGDIILDAGGAQIRFHDDGTDIGVFSNESGNFIIKPQVSDADLIIKGNDGGSTITALTLDMSEAGAATFNSEVFIPEKLTHTGDTDTHFKFAGANDIRIVAGNVEHAAFDGTIVFNQSGADMDFRVESTGNANMLFVDAGNDRIGIGTNAPTSPLTVAMDAGGVATFTGISSGGVSSVLMKQSRGSIASPSNSSTAGDGNYILSQVYNSGYATIGSIGIITGSALNNGDIQFNTAISGTVSERMRLNGRNLGLGTSAPNSNGGGSATVLHIHDPDASNWAVTHYTNGSTGSASGDGFIAGNIGSDVYLWNYESSPMLFATASQERMRLDSTGVLKFAGGSAVDNANTNFNINLPATGGITIGSAYTFANIHGDSGGSVYIKANAYPANTGSATFIKLRTANASGGTDSDVTVSGGNIAFASGNGIDFSATGDSSGTMSSELLDDYEEGTFEPTITGVGTPSYANRNGWYTKVGDTVHFTVQLLFGNVTSSSTYITIGGLPFTTINSANYYPVPSVFIENGITDTQADAGYSALVILNTNTVNIYAQFQTKNASSGVNYDQLRANNLTASTNNSVNRIRVSGSYKAA